MAQNELLKAIDKYVSAVIALEASVANPWGHFSSDHDLEDAISNILLGRTAVLSKVCNLCVFEVYFNRIQNQSKKLVPVNLLSLEIMTHIITLAWSTGCSLNATLSVFDYPV